MYFYVEIMKSSAVIFGLFKSCCGRKKSIFTVLLSLH